MAFFQAPLPHQTSALAHAPMLCFDRMIAPARAANQPSGIRYAFETTCSLKAAQAKDHDSIFTSEPDRKSGKTGCKKVIGFKTVVAIKVRCAARQSWSSRNS
jgi:hypothetical protein